MGGYFASGGLQVSAYANMVVHFLVAQHFFAGVAAKVLQHQGRERSFTVQAVVAVCGRSDHIELRTQVLQVFAGDFAGVFRSGGIGGQVLVRALLLVLQVLRLIFKVVKKAHGVAVCHSMSFNAAPFGIVL